MSENTQNTQTNTSSEGNTKSSSRSRKWCFTFNNYSESDIPVLINWCNTKNIKYIFGKEIAPTTGTPHLQGYLEMKNPMMFSTLKNHWPTWSIRQAKGDIVSNFEYCSKDNNYFTNIFIEKPDIISEDKLFPWQKELLDILNTNPNDRDIIWIYDEDGKKGKTSFGKFCYFHEKAFYCRGGKASDIKSLVLMHKNSRDFIIDYSRSVDGFVSYSLIEELKDGYIFSTKYEGGMKLISTPHVIIFANFEPEYCRLSKDRWKIYIINDKNKLEEFNS